MNNYLFILFGATGDLSRRKIIPALYRLIAEKKVDRLILLATGREQTDIETILNNARSFIEHVDETTWQQYIKQSTYHQVDITNQQDFLALADTITNLENTYATSNRLVYCATAADFFCDITNHVTQTNILQKQSIGTTPWHRIIYEKPFGHNLESAHAINTCIKQSLEEHQVYRIDHYLTKEIVTNIALIRFTNCVFEPLWNNRFIDQVHIILSESIDIEKRGQYYDAYGAMRDVVQNHMLQLLALIGMESPSKLQGDYIRDKRVQVLQHVEFIDGIYGQYEGYTQEEHVDLHSTTETFAVLRLHVNNVRWSGVPFYLKTGKALPKKSTAIHIKFKQVDCLLTKQCPPSANWLTIQIEPDAGFILTLNAKSTEDASMLMPIEMSYCHSCIFGASSSQAYELLLQEILRGEQSVSVRFDEIESAWKLIDSILDHKKVVYPYKKGSDGPKELETFSRKHGIRWHS